MTDPISISVNFDSLNEAYGFPPGYRDPSFFKAFDRLATLATKYNFPLSIYIIGRDLEHADHAARVREWSQMGHEIGNHTWSHHFNIGSLPRAAIRDEVSRAHDRLAEVTGSEPVGFICPAWATSNTVIATLIDLRYEYDTSTFPSVLLYPMILRIAINNRNNPRKALRMLHRRDWHVPITAPLAPYMVGPLVILPLPTVGRLSPAIWHTIGFAIGWQYCFQGMRTLLRDHPGFYYLIHPGDFLSPAELHPTHVHGHARMDVPLAEKIARLDEAFSVMKDSGRPAVTMRAAAAHHRMALESV
jgi:peptidoglycan/xylan/chitin deacetylase (PgdA/CDA1 family)